MCMRCVSDVDAAVTALGGAAGLRIWIKAKLEDRRNKRTPVVARDCDGKRRPQPEPAAPSLRIRPVRSTFDPASMGVLVPADGSPRLPRDPEDHERDPEADDRVREIEAKGDDRGARDHAEADVGVGAGVVAVGD